MDDFHDEVRKNVGTMPVRVVTSQGSLMFENIEVAKRSYPSLDPFHNGGRFTWAMRDNVGGHEVMRFEDWPMHARVMGTLVQYASPRHMREVLEGRL